MLTLILDIKLKVDAANSLRDSLEHYTSGQIYPAFLKKLVPIFVSILNGQPVFVSTSGEQVRPVYSPVSSRICREVLIIPIEAAQLRPRNSPSIAYESSGAFRAIYSSACRPAHGTGQG